MFEALMPDLVKMPDNEVISMLASGFSKPEAEVAGLVNSPGGQMFLKALRSRATVSPEEQQRMNTVLCRCPLCDFAFETSLSK